MNRNFENRKPTKVYAKSKENQMIIKALNMYGRVPEMWELLKEIERLNNIIEEVREIFKDYGDKEDIVGYTMYNITGEQLINILDIVNKALGSDKK